MTRLDHLVTRLRAAGCVFAEEEAGLLVEAAGSEAELEALTVRRVAGEPLEYVLGWAAFRGVRVSVDPGVFVPRRRTEFLVEQAVPLTRPGSIVVDLCCGSGALGVALATAVPEVEVHAADVDDAAVRCARRNVSAVGGRVHQGDLFAALPVTLCGRVDVLVVNPPYVPTEAIVTMPSEARDHEARAALDGGADGLDVLRRVVAEAPRWLAPSGHLLVELGEPQIAAAIEAVTVAGLTSHVVHDEDVGGTVLIGCRRHDPRPARRRQ